MQKHNVVVLHSFPTNSVILKGFYDFLEDYFNVFPIDLPGFMKQVDPLEKITVRNYARYVLDRIEDLQLSNYWIAGVSFGFYVANLVKDDQKCKGYLAIEPFIGVKGLKMPKARMMLFRLILKVITALNLCYRIWESRILHNHLFSKGCGSSITALKLIKKHVNPRTFFHTAQQILQTDEVVFNDKPYVLIVNPDDVTVDAAPIIKKFRQLGQMCCMISTTSEHFPEEISREYFQRHVPKAEIGKILSFMSRF